MIPIRDNVPHRSVPVVTWSLIAVNVLVFLYELTLGPHGLEHFVYLFGLVPARYSHPEWALRLGLPVDDYWPFLTSMFVHGGWAHVIGNMWALWIFGDNVERMGRGRFLIFYLLTGLVAGLTPYFAMFPRAQIIVLFPVLFWPFFFQLPAAVYLSFWALSQIFMGTLAGLTHQTVGGVAWWAHFGGFVAGVLLHRLFVFRRREAARRRWALDEYGVEGAWMR